MKRIYTTKESVLDDMVRNPNLCLKCKDHNEVGEILDTIREYDICKVERFTGDEAFYISYNNDSGFSNKISHHSNIVIYTGKDFLEIGKKDKI